MLTDSRLMWFTTMDSVGIYPNIRLWKFSNMDSTTAKPSNRSSIHCKFTSLNCPLVLFCMNVGWENDLSETSTKVRYCFHTRDSETTFVSLVMKGVKSVRCRADQFMGSFEVPCFPVELCNRWAVLDLDFQPNFKGPPLFLRKQALSFQVTQQTYSLQWIRVVDTHSLPHLSSWLNSYSELQP